MCFVLMGKDKEKWVYIIIDEDGRDMYFFMKRYYVFINRDYGSFYVIKRIFF